MKKIFFGVLIAALVLLSAVCVTADASNAKQAWLDAKEQTQEKLSLHQDAKLALAGDNTPENVQAVIDTGKEYQRAVLDEAEAWLTWKKIEAQENEMITDELRNRILDDVQTNMDKIDALRDEVDAVQNQFQLGGVSLRMIGKYFELLTDVSRNTGLAWVHVANTHADKLGEFEEKIRNAAEDLDDNEDIMEKLDSARRELETARENIDKAEDTYKAVEIGKTPFVKAREGNMYLRAAKQNMLSAHAYLRQALVLLRGN
ncbi:MAG: hypothetical protein KKE20_07100 [Nanoarchaeota archaeon]|nr:hypothetical protein [Nanoarchaeota archaeon]